MSLPYENSSAGTKALAETEKMLRAFGCTSFGSMMRFDDGVLIVQFEYRGRQVQVKASINGYAAAWLREHPYSSRMRMNKIEHERMAKEKGGTAVYSILRDWLRGQITAIETGMLSFEGAFLGAILLSDGRTVLERVEQEKFLPPSSNNVQLLEKKA
jgi:hypothetical protein